MATERKTAEQRRADVLRVAVPEFARGGLEGTSTDAVARAAGISQPYLFRLFPTKKALFIELVKNGFARVRDAMEQAAGDLTGDEALMAMGDVYADLLADRNELLLQMQAYVACNDPEIGEVVRREFGRLWRLIAAISGADEEQLQRFVGMGMLMNVIAAMDATSHGAAWVKACVSPDWLMGDGDGEGNRVEPASSI
jgi:AcrR family transcriptional regulator